MTASVLPGGTVPADDEPARKPVQPYPANRLVAYRDDGMISQALGRLTEGQIPPLLPLVIAGMVTTVLLGVGVAGENGFGLFAPVLLLLFVGPSSSNPHAGRLDWLVPTLLRAIEYGYLAVLGFSDGVPPGVIFAFIGVLAYHHYDTVYRTRQRLWPAEWVFRAGLGWEGRMIIAAIAAFADALPVAYVVLTVYLGVLFGAESIHTWTRTERASGVMINLEDEEEAGS